MHHVCYEVDDICAARDRLKAAGARVLGDGEPRIGAHDKPVLFLHPKDFCGTLDRARAGVRQAMSVATGLMVYAIVWWTVIFAVLPWGVRTDRGSRPGHATGAPENPRLGVKALAITGISAVIWLAIELLVRSDLISFRDMASRM